MKCIQFSMAVIANVRDSIKRVDDVSAANHVAHGVARYVPKSKWKQARRDISNQVIE